MDHAITTAARALLREIGYRKLTVDAVASRAGIGKAAIYRRYGSKEEMIFAAVLHQMDVPPPPDSGSLRGDLVALGRVIVASLVGPPDGVVLSLLADIYADAAMVARFTETYVAAERASVSELLDRAVRRGELAARPDPVRLHALLLGPIFAWLFLLRQEPAGAGAFADTVAEHAASVLTRRDFTR